jgi:hypothetical protein
MAAASTDPIEFLEALCAAFPQFADKISPMASLHQRKCVSLFAKLTFFHVFFLSTPV